MLSSVRRAPPVAARVLFVHAVGVLFAAEGSSEVTRRYVWAPFLETLLAPHPEVCVVYLRAEDEPEAGEALKGRLGRLGHRLIDVVPVNGDRIENVLRDWRRHHPEVAEVRLLIADGMTGGGGPAMDASFAIRGWASPQTRRKYRCAIGSSAPSVRPEHFRPRTVRGGDGQVPAVVIDISKHKFDVAR